jgi:hypothetical protein
VSHHGCWIGYARSVADLERWVELAALEETLNRLAALGRISMRSAQRAHALCARRRHRGGNGGMQQADDPARGKPGEGPRKQRRRPARQAAGRLPAVAALEEALILAGPRPRSAWPDRAGAGTRPTCTPRSGTGRSGARGLRLLGASGRAIGGICEAGKGHPPRWRRPGDRSPGDRRGTTTLVQPGHPQPEAAKIKFDAIPALPRPTRSWSYC